MESKEIVYVGSTTKFSQRKTAHKHDCNNKEGKHFTIPIYCHIRDNGGFNCFEVIPIQSLKLENKTQLLIAEQVEIDKHRNLVNRQKAHMTIEDRKEYDKQYREEHKEDSKEYHKQYRQEHKENIKEKQKQYVQEHKEDIKQYKKLYWEEHKETIDERVKCPICNSTSLRRQLKRHQRTKKCQQYLNK